MTKQELAKLMYDIHDYCHYVNGCCEDCAISPCGLIYENSGFTTFPYEWDIEVSENEK